MVERSERAPEWPGTLEEGPRVDLERLIDDLESRVEASKQVIDSSLRGSGYLDAKYAQRRVTVRPEQESADIAVVWDSGPRYRFGPVRFSGPSR